MSLLLGVLIASFIIHALSIVPFVNFLYKLRFFKNKSSISSNMTDEASVHIRSKARTPEGGGLLILVITSIIFAVTLPILRRLGIEVTHVFPINDEINIIFFTFIAYGLLGLYDDVVKFFELQREQGYSGLKTSHKFLIQIALGLIVGAMMYLNLGIDIIHVPFLGALHFGWWFVPIASFFIVMFANAVNITDGMDGLAGGLLMICLFGFLVVSASILDVPLSVFIALWLGGLLAFLYFNVFPARIFMGDVGALAFGATLATVGLLTGKLIAMIIVGFPFLVDGFSSLIQILSVKILKRRILPIAPIHYYLLKIGWSEPKIVQRAWLAGIICVIFGIWLAII